jgi:uncharacterized protein with FMN-binding domain
MTLRHRAALGAMVAVATAGCAGTDDAVRSQAVPSNTASAGPANDRYRDGTYRAEGEYGGLPSHIKVEVTLDDGLITDVDVTPRATDPTSLDLQSRFAAAVSRVAVGRPIDTLEVGKLAGSSGTPQGFNDALEQIRAQSATDADTNSTGESE